MDSVESQITFILNEHFNIENLEVINESYMHNVPINSETHFKLILVSDDFFNMSLIHRHKKIYLILEHLMKKIHALSIHAFTYDEYQKNNRSLESPNCKN
ncbi:MAG: protein BolA [SAR86 cluster bacterium SAR86B]|uniref:Protein BolA n=1 Tax=SAR86 cluster bacterium SAR86B TaxID=1123867 RepID=J4WWM3_9GAMM|nr:MAG: protein BolA [SAR86 cluster bacterium SAR86B]